MVDAATQTDFDRTASNHFPNSSSMSNSSVQTASSVQGEAASLLPSDASASASLSPYQAKWAKKMLSLRPSTVTGTAASQVSTKP